MKRTLDTLAMTVSSIRRSFVVVGLVIGIILSNATFSVGGTLSRAEQAHLRLISENSAQQRKVSSSVSTREEKEVVGGIEIGSKGVKAIVIEVKSEPEGYSVNRKFEETKNTTLMRLDGCKFRQDTIKETANIVGEYHSRMRNEQGLSDKRIHIIGSSGLLVGNGKEGTCNTDELARAVSQITGADMKFLTAADEVKLAINGTIPKWVRINDKVVNNLQQSILVDIGSGNTKGGYKQLRQTKSNATYDYYTFEIPKATVTFTQEVDKTLQANIGQTFAQTAEALSADLIRKPLSEQIEIKPGLGSKARVYLSGGIVWALATLIHPENRGDWVEITAADIKKFKVMAVNNPTGLLNPDLSRIKEERVKAEVLNELEKVRGTFSPKNLVAGAEILSVLNDELDLGKRRVRFARLGLYGWILSYTELQSRID